MFVLPVTPSHALAHRALARRAVSQPGWSRAVDRWLDEGLERHPARAAHVPALDVAESDTAYTLTVDLPGMSKEQVKVSVQGRSVSIEASQADPAPATEGDRVLYRERSTPRYARRINLPVTLDAAATQARFDNGVLTVTLPKLQPVGSIDVKVN